MVFFFFVHGILFLTFFKIYFYFLFFSLKDLFGFAFCVVFVVDCFGFVFCVVLLIDFP